MKKTFDPVKDVADMKQFLFEKSSKPRFSGKAAQMDEQSRIMGTMLPDEIIHDPQNHAPRLIEAAVLFADVSGKIYNKIMQKF